MNSIRELSRVQSIEPPDLTFDGLAELSDGQVKERLSIWAGRVAAGEARLLAYIGELDARRAWVEEGIGSCQSWLSWRLGMGASAAYERLRVARALRSLPLVFAAFQAGRVSYSQVRALTRMPIDGDEQSYLDLAHHASGAQLERLAGGMRRAARFAEDDRRRKAGEPPAEQKPRASVRYDADGDLLITLRLPAAPGQVLLAALEAACADLDADTPKSAPKDSSAEESGPPRASKGAGFLALAKNYLNQRARVRPKRVRHDRAKLVCHVDPLSGWVRLPDGELLPPKVAAHERLTLAEGTNLRRLRRSDLTRYDAGRSRREPHQRLRDLLASIDGERCRYPGCSRTQRLHAHHVLQWVLGGRTDLANLILVCEQHHLTIHRQQIQLTLDPRSRVLHVATRAGEPVPERNQPPWGPADHLDDGRHVTADTIRPVPDDRPLDLHYAVEVLLRRAETLSRAAA